MHVGIDAADRRHPSALVDGFGAILDQVKEEAGDQRFIGKEQRQARIDIEDELDAAAAMLFPLQQHNIVEDGVQVDRRQLQGARGSKIHEFGEEIADAADFADHHLGIFTEIVTVVEFAVEKLRGAANPAERILDLVGETGRHDPGYGKLIAAPDRIFQFTDAGQVAEDNDGAVELAGMVEEREG